MQSTLINVARAGVGMNRYCSGFHKKKGAALKGDSS